MVFRFRNNDFLNFLSQLFWTKRLLGPQNPKKRHYEKLDKFIGFKLNF